MFRVPVGLIRLVSNSEERLFESLLPSHYTDDRTRHRIADNCDAFWTSDSSLSSFYKTRGFLTMFKKPCHQSRPEPRPIILLP
jgi:hypothetical protein